MSMLLICECFSTHCPFFFTSLKRNIFNVHIFPDADFCFYFHFADENHKISHTMWVCIFGLKKTACHSFNTEISIQFCFVLVKLNTQRRKKRSQCDTFVINFMNVAHFLGEKLFFFFCKQL